MAGPSFHSFIEEAFLEHLHKGLGTQTCKIVDTQSWPKGTPTQGRREGKREGEERGRKRGIKKPRAVAGDGSREQRRLWGEGHFRLFLKCFTPCEGCARHSFPMVQPKKKWKQMCLCPVQVHPGCLVVAPALVQKSGQREA